MAQKIYRKSTNYFGPNAGHLPKFGTPQDLSNMAPRQEYLPQCNMNWNEFFILKKEVRKHTKEKEEMVLEAQMKRTE